MNAKILYGVLGISIAALAWGFPALGGMSSPSYEVPTHVLDSGGAESGSAGYVQVSALGQSTPPGVSQSASYLNRAGYIAQAAMLLGGACQDDDGDGYSDQACGGDDCDDTDPDVNPGAAESCYDATDNDCDGLMDHADPDCDVEFALGLDATYELGILTMYFTLRTPEPVTWATYLVLTSPIVKVLPLWKVLLPVIDPSMGLPVAFPLPSQRWVGIYTGLFTVEGAQAVRLVWVNTG